MTHTANKIASALINSYLELGQPFEDCGCATSERPRGCRRCRRLARDLRQLSDNLLQPTVKIELLRERSKAG